MSLVRVQKSNRLIEGKKSFSSGELSLFAFILSKSQMIESKGFKQLAVKVGFSDYNRYLGGNEKNHSLFYRKAKALQEKPILLHSPTEKDPGHYTSYNLFTHLEISPGQGTIDFFLNPQLSSDFLDLKKRYTQIPILESFQLRKKYSGHFYELFKSWEFKAGKSKQFTQDLLLEEIRTSLMLGESYKKYSNLRSRVLVPSINEINRHSDMRCSFTPYDSLGEIVAGQGKKQIDFIRFVVKYGHERVVELPNIDLFSKALSQNNDSQVTQEFIDSEFESFQNKHKDDPLHRLLFMAEMNRLHGVFLDENLKIKVLSNKDEISENQRKTFLSLITKVEGLSVKEAEVVLKKLSPKERWLKINELLQKK